MKNDLSGMVALVTGSTRGIGHAAATILRDAGASVIRHGRAETEVAAKANRLGTRGIPADLGPAVGGSALAEAAGAVDILINTAGIFGPVDFFETGDAVRERHWQVNVMRALRL